MVYARRCRCALPGCPRGDETFSTMQEGNAHMWEIHGLRVHWPRYEDGLLVLDPAAHPPRKRGHARDFCPTPEEYARLVEGAKDELDRLIFLTLGQAGLRSKELLYLRPAWLRDGKLHVPHEDPVTGFRAKTRNAARAIPLREMSPAAWEVLERWYTNPPRRATWSGKTPLGVSHPTLWMRVRKGGVRAGLSRRIFPHALRSYCAGVWAYRIQNPFTLMTLMGWNDVKTAMVYIRSSGRALEDAVMTWNGSNGHNGNNGGSVPSPGSPRLT